MRDVRPALARYRTWLLDCDGVLLDSNRLKTDAFRAVALEFGEAAADQLVAYHVEHGGVSRHVKFRYLQERILGRAFDEHLQARLLAAFSNKTKAMLLECPITEGCLELLGALGRRRATAFVVSGGDQDDLREVFAARDLAKHFAGIYGSPETKPAIIDALRARNACVAPAVFVGDARADHQAAERAGADFVFVHRYSEMEGWREYVAARPSIAVVATLAELLE
jgi:phosphoglycolate phosphatase-like HAD superfamily hydrolase